MSTGPMMSIGGIASGLPPDLVDQIMEAERQPLNRLVARQEGLAEDREAWTAVTQKLSGVRSAVDEVRRGDSFADLFKAETTGDAADVAVTGRPPQGSASFEVTQLAQAQRSFSDHAFDGLDAALGDLTLAIDGTDVTADLDAEATLADLVDAVNAADLGVTASTVQVEPGSYSLVLAGTETGAEQAFTVDAGGGWGFQTARAAQDAELDVEGLAVSRPSNTIDDLFEGLTLELQETGPATVTAERDVDAAVEQVTGLVERVNEAIGTLSELTAYDPETDEAGPLQGDRTARSIMDDLRGALTGLANPGGEEGFRRASDVGIESTRTGEIQLDEAALREAFATDFDAAAEVFTRGGSSSDPAVADVSAAARATEPGDYDVDITKAARVAKITGGVELPPPGEPHRLRITAGGDAVIVNLSDAETIQHALDKINSALAEASLDDVVEVVPPEGVDPDTPFGELAEGEGDLDVVGTRYGSAHSLETAWERTDGTWDVAGENTGGDAVVTLTDSRGEEITTTSQGQSVVAHDGAAEGLRFTAAGAEGAAAALTVSQGLGGTMDAALARMEGVTGSVRRASDSMQSRIDLLGDRIESYERRLESRRQTLERQFAGMESAMGRLMDQQQQLQGQLGGLPGNA